MSLSHRDDPSTTVVEPGAVRPRRGRPRANQAGEVERRVLDAATALFLDQGYGRTTLDQVAELAHAGKTTLYARFPRKEDLFAAVVHRCVHDVLDKMAIVPKGRTASKRLAQVGLELSHRVLVPEVVALMRITAAEAETFPELAREGYGIGFGGSVDFVARSIAASQSREDVEAARAVATRFVELALHPLQMKALYGADLIDLRARAASDVGEIVDLLRAKGLLEA